MKKRIFSLALVILSLVSIVLFATSCSNDAELKFSKVGSEYKYVYEYKTEIAGVKEDHLSFFYFKKDGTGGYIYDHIYKNVKTITTAGVVYFEWKEGSDGKIYLFETGVEYYDRNTDGQEIHLPTVPITTGDGFISFEMNGVHYRYMLQKD